MASKKLVAGAFVAGTLAGFYAGASLQRASHHQERFRIPALSEPISDASARAPRQSQPIPDLSPAAERFYAEPANEGFCAFIEGITESLHDDAHADGRMTAKAQQIRFGGDRQVMDRAIKSEIYRLLESSAERGAAAASDYGIIVSGSGDEMSVAIENPRLARQSLRNHILLFVRSLDAVNQQ